MTQPAHWLADPKPGAACAVIAEVAQAHDGSLGMAHAYIDAAAQTGATAGKFQTHIAAEESTPAEPWRVKFSRQDETRFDYWRRMEFTAEQWAGLKVHAEDRGLVFLSSPFSMKAVELLERLGVAAWKVASGELTNLAMVAAMAQTGKPVMLSTGMSPMTEIGAAVAVVQAHAAPFAIFQCTTQYPSPPEAIGLNVLADLRRRFSCAVGISDHSATIYPGLAAVAAHGAELIEVHLTLSRTQFGPDVVASLTPDELKVLVDGVGFMERMKAAPLNKEAIDPRVAPMRAIFFKSVVALQDLPQGTVLKREHLGVKKPGTGIPAAQLDVTIGRTLNRAVKRNDVLKPEDVQ